MMNSKEITITMPRRTASLLWGSMKMMFEMQLNNKFEMSRETSIILQQAWTNLSIELDKKDNSIIETDESMKNELESIN